MKNTLSTLALMISIVAAKSQGTIDFTSQANPVEFAPAGGNAVCIAQLFWAPVGSSTYTAVSGNPVGFQSGAKSGFWNASLEPVVTTPGLAGGSQVMVYAQVSGGTAVDDTGNGLWAGRSASILVTTGNAGSPFTAPASIAGIPSFTVALAMPEPSTMALCVMGAGGLFLRRRRKDGKTGCPEP